MRWNTLLLAIIVGVFAFTVQSYAVGYQGPKRTAAHGYVVVHQGRELVFDSALGLYSVKGYRSLYYNEGYYYRVYSAGRFARCRTVNGAWKSISPSRLPPGLAKKYGAHPSKHRGKGHND